MEKFFLGFGFAGDKLNVVNDQHVIGAVLVLENMSFIRLHRGHKLVGEALRRDILNFRASGFFFGGVPYCLQQVGFSEAHSPINKKRVVGLSQILTDGERGGMRQFVE